MLVRRFLPRVHLLSTGKRLVKVGGYDGTNDVECSHEYDDKTDFDRVDDGTTAIFDDENVRLMTKPFE